MENKKRSSLAVSDETRQLINAMRGTHSADEYLMGVLTYIRLYGIKPMGEGNVAAPAQNKMSNCNDVMKRLEDVIKIIRSFEKNMKGMMEDAIPGGEHAKTDSQFARENERLQEALAKLREQLSEKDGGGDTAKATQLYEMTIRFLEENADADGTILMGKGRTARFRDELTRVFHG